MNSANHYAMPPMCVYVRACVHVQLWNMPSVIWRCWLDGRKGIWPVKKLSDVVLIWLSVWSEVPICFPIWCHYHSQSLASVKGQIGFTFLVPAHPGSLGQRAVKRVRDRMCSYVIYASYPVDGSKEVICFGLLVHLCVHACSLAISLF